MNIYYLPGKRLLYLQNNEEITFKNIDRTVSKTQGDLGIVNQCKNLVSDKLSITFAVYVIYNILPMIKYLLFNILIYFILFILRFIKLHLFSIFLNVKRP